MTCVAIRADASVQIGTGHVMRCLALAEKLKERKMVVVFLCRELDGHLCGLIAARGHTVHRLPHSVELALDWYWDAQQSIAALRGLGQQLEWIIVDHYQLDVRWEEMLRVLPAKVMAIDDVADRPHDCDLLLDQNLSRAMTDRYARLVSPQCRRLLGPRYALLRHEFLEARMHLRQRDGGLHRALVFFGGGDPTNETAKALGAIQQSDRQDMVVDVVVGSSNPHCDEIMRLCETLPNLRFHCQVDNMAELMVRADLAIGAGGTSTWERCCVGLPALVAILAENQRELTEAVEEQGAIVNLGWADRLSTADYLCAINALGPERLARMSQWGIELVDGRGTELVAQALS